MTTTNVMTGLLTNHIPQGFKRRALETQIFGAERTERDFRPTFGLVLKDAYSYEVDHLNDFDSILIRACRNLGARPNALIELDNLIRDPRLPAMISSKIYPRDMVPVDTKIPVIIFNEFRDGIREAIKAVAPNLDDREGFNDFILYLYGRPAVEAGFVLPAPRTAAIKYKSGLIPSYEEIKSGGLATLLVRVASSFKGKIIEFRGDRIAPKMLFQTIRESLTDVSEQLLALRYQWDALDALAAVAVGKLVNEFDMDPARAGFLRHPEVDQFLSNFTLVNAALEYYKSSPASYKHALPAQVTAEAYSNSFKGLVQAVVTSELFDRVDLSDFQRKTDITRIFTPGRLAVALMMEPSIVITPKVQVSYLANTDFKRGVVLTPMVEVERTMQGFVSAVKDVASTSIVDMHNVIVDVLFEDGDMLLAEAGATLALNANVEPGVLPAMHYTPEVMYRNCDETYIKHVAAASAAYMGVSIHDDEFVLTYFVSPTTPDIQFLLTPIATGISATEDAALVVLLSGDLANPVARATESWATGAQVLDDHTRSSVIVDYTGELKIFPDITNALDHKLKISFKLSKAMEQQLGTSKLNADVSMYQLLGGPDYQDANIVQAHLNPVLHMETVTMMNMLVGLFDSTDNARGRQAVIASTVKLVKDLMNTREFEIVFRGVLANLAMQLNSPAARMMFQRSSANQFDMVPLKLSILFKMLLRTRLIDNETHDRIVKSKLFTSDNLISAISVSI